MLASSELNENSDLHVGLTNVTQRVRRRIHGFFRRTALVEAAGKSRLSHSEHAVVVCGFVGHDLQDVPVFDNLALGVEAKDVLSRVSIDEKRVPLNSSESNVTFCLTLSIGLGSSPSAKNG